MKKSVLVYVSITALFVLIMCCVMIGRSCSFAPSPTHAPNRFNQIDLNTASEDELSILPGIGPTLAKRIVEYRQDNGPYTSVEELLNVHGLGKSKLEQIRLYITVGG